jgi:hypothetical protein
MRLTVRRMMLAVAVFTVALHVGLSYRRSADYQREALFYTRAGEAALERAHAVESGAARLRGYTAEEVQRVADQARRFADYASRQKAKYERAAYLPFFPVKPDPPPP